MKPNGYACQAFYFGETFDARKDRTGLRWRRDTTLDKNQRKVNTWRSVLACRVIRKSGHQLRPWYRLDGTGDPIETRLKRNPSPW